MSISNEIPNNSPTPWYYDNLHLSENMPPKFIVVIIRYSDPILEKEFNQQFYMNGKQAMIRSGWIIEHGLDTPRLTSCYPL